MTGCRFFFVNATAPTEIYTLSLHDRSSDLLFTLDPSSPNVLAGHKRPLHTIIPAFMTRGQVRIAFGIMGGWRSEEHTSELQSRVELVCRLLLEKKKRKIGSVPIFAVAPARW